MCSNFSVSRTSQT